MTAPAMPPLTASTEVRQDALGHSIVVLRMACGPVSCEFFILPTDAERFGEGVSGALRTAAEQAQNLGAGLVIPPQGLITPKNGTRRP